MLVVRGDKYEIYLLLFNMCYVAFAYEKEMPWGGRRMFRVEPCGCELMFDESIYTWVITYPCKECEEE